MDLHLHSTYSDGQLTPCELIIEACHNQVGTISFTDHDNIDGYFAGIRYARAMGIRLIPGIELNTENNQRELHILGYDFNPLDKKLRTHIRWRRAQSLDWGILMVKHLITRGFNIDFDILNEQSRLGIINRTNIASRLLVRGDFSDFHSAYQAVQWEAEKVPLTRSAFSAIEAIKLIHQAGGEAYLAHPGIYTHEYDLEELVAAGLDGIEVFYPLNSQEATTCWLNEASRFQLKMSGGSDYHGPDSKSPYPVGSVKLEPELFEQWNPGRGVKNALGF